ncbi:Crp/Fnr family transcriptional regulator [Cohnella caldifontis]|uniref:Crp/Fnr family transcriptional regulator n=1 Tax=Cohnella caldifontis TaxID=3027471 RepID=UPI0023EE22CB|nr:Crp/Fnr family transcriptional regulator [Cohnella sp. YIM B05605]
MMRGDSATTLPDARLLDAFPCLRAVGSEEWSEARPTVRAFPAGTRFFQREDAASYGMFLLSGTARISRIAADGSESVMAKLSAGEVCALLVLSGLSGRDYPGALTAETDTEALFVAKRSFLRWLHAYDDLRSSVFGGLLDGMLRMSEQSESRRTEPLEARLARALLHRAAEGQSLLNVTHQELAAEIGSAREVVSRALRRFRNCGWVETGRGWVRVLRRQALETQLRD